MATMYPVIFPPGAAKSIGIAFEKQLFHTLTKLPDDWHVFYAPRCERGPNGDQAYVDDEISDFVLVSEKGIVMIEGKATTVTWNNEDIMASYGNTKKSVVFQLNRAKRRLGELIRQNNQRGVSEAGIGTIVAIERTTSPTIVDWPIGSNECEVRIIAGFPRLISEKDLTKTPKLRGLDDTDLRKVILSALKESALKTFPHLKSGVTSLLLEYQRAVLDTAQTTPPAIQQHDPISGHLLITGRAGTGKTEIIKQEVERLCRSGHTSTVGCYNVKLAEELETALGHLKPKPTVVTVADLARRIAGDEALDPGQEAIGADQRAAFELVVEAALGAAAPLNNYSYLMIDEAQDLIAAELNLLATCFPPTQVRWVVAFDESQAWRPQHVCENDIKKILVTKATPVTLTANLRCSRTVHQYCAKLLGHPKGYAVFSKNAEGKVYDEVIISPSDTTAVVQSLITKFHNDHGAAFSDIMILTSQSHNIINGEDPKQTPWISLGDQLKLGSDTISIGKDITLDTIKRYKGKQSPIVIGMIHMNPPYNDLTMLQYLAASRSSWMYAPILIK